MEKNIVIVHYNTPLLTECLVKSINLFVEDAKIYIFDNSDKLPFTAKFDNVTIIDNTKGQIINFDEWLKKYPNKNKSTEATHCFGSAKHCYSIEKCLEMFEENFILLDSDILLKKDISELYDDNILYAGETIMQPNSTIKRILPFICYINVKECKKNGVHFFNENYMHGLFHIINNKYADRYDTGAYFHLVASKYCHKDIKTDEYVVHYKAGSWVNNAKKLRSHIQTKTIDEWLKYYKKLWSNEKNKKVVYTCITGDYDSLIEPKYITDGFDYICFTDNKEIKSDVWIIKPLPQETDGLSQVKKQRYVKINAHKVVGEYDLSIWVDGNVEIKGDLNVFLKKTLADDCSVYVPTHPSRKCIYAEARAVVSMRKDTNAIVNKQMDRYKKEGFPTNYGLLQSNIMLRKHNNADCIRLMEKWFSELKEESHRDQLSFNYASWKNEDVKVKYMEKMIYRSAWFNWKGKHKKINRINPSIKQNKVNTNNLNKTIISTNKTSYHQKYVFKQSLNRKIPTHKLVIYG